MRDDIGDRGGRSVRRLTTAYEVRGLTSKLTSYDNAVVGSGSIVNDVALTYNAFGQILSDAQSHSGVVVPGTTPQVQYAYANGSTNTIRPTTLTYPNGRAMTIGYGTAGGINDSISRVDGLIDGATTLVNYAYLGLGAAVQTTYPQPSTQYTLLGSSAGNSPAGDVYWGLDRFGRIIDSRWFNTGTTTDVDRIKYGYDRASNRMWRQNPVATAAGAQFDKYYTNDGLQRLKDMQRGTLNGTNTAITSPTFKQCWTLDATGNWRGFNESTTGSSWTTVQSRTANPVNEITNITNTVGSSWVTPAYDAAGNMTTIPVGQGATAGWAELSVGGWAALNVDDWATLPVSGTTDTYKATYGAWNRLVTMSSAGSGQIIQQNQYDVRTFRTVIQTFASGVLSETRHSYFTSDWQCVEERTGAFITADRQFVWGARYIDDLVCRNRPSEALYALQDANWGVTSIIDASGTVQERCSYTAFGQPKFLTSTFGPRIVTSFSWEILYCGYRYDRDCRLYSVRYRFYHPSLGAWCSRDPLDYIDNASLYASFSVLNVTDPSGLAIRVCFRQFYSSGKGDYSDEEWADMFNNEGWFVPRVAHVFLQVEFPDGKKHSYSYHPNVFGKQPTTVDALTTSQREFDINKRRPARVAMDDPLDLDCGKAGYKGEFECYDIPCEEGVDEIKLMKYIDAWIQQNKAGMELGALTKKDPLNRGNTIGKLGCVRPQVDCTAMYWVRGQNCAWWSTQMIKDIKLKVPNHKRERWKRWNNDIGIGIKYGPKGKYPSGIMDRKPPIPTDLGTVPPPLPIQ